VSEKGGRLAADISVTAKLLSVWVEELDLGFVGLVWVDLGSRTANRESTDIKAVAEGTGSVSSRILSVSESKGLSGAEKVKLYYIVVKTGYYLTF
jgi:hypothetical protein